MNESSTRRNTDEAASIWATLHSINLKLELWEIAVSTFCSGSVSTTLCASLHYFPIIGTTQLVQQSEHGFWYSRQLSRFRCNVQRILRHSTRSVLCEPILAYRLHIRIVPRNKKCVIWREKKTPAKVYGPLPLQHHLLLKSHCIRLSRWMAIHSTNVSCFHFGKILATLGANKSISCHRQLCSSTANVSPRRMWVETNARSGKNQPELL